ncbi:nucleoside triphosphate pyrophosphohydrolase [Thermodesulfobacteriota bacterium]
MDIKRDFKDLKEIVTHLRGENGCPWDKEQDEHSIKNYLLEETYEIIEAIEKNDYENLKEELGDTLFEILFLADIADEKGHFDIYDSINCAYEKFVRRHPHVFEKGADENHANMKSSDVVELWSRIKKEEKPSDKRDILHDVSKILPALLRASEVSSRAAKVGFDWEKASDVIDKIDEEAIELKEALTHNNVRHIEEELGDMLFAMVNLCRHLKVNPEIALNNTTNKFINRFAIVQEKADYNLSDKSLEVLESFWEEAKKLEQ